MVERSIGMYAPRRRWIILLTVVSISLAFLVKLVAQEPPPYPYDDANRSLDTLAYVSEDHQLILYDVQDRAETTLLQNVSSFVLSRDGRVAFTTVDENDHALYVVDPSLPATDPVVISQNPAAIHYPLSWSPDGRYVTFASFGELADYPHYIWTYQGSYVANSRDQSLFVWDGEKVTNIMPEDALAAAAAFRADWSEAGRLAFLIIHGWSMGAVPNELYLWDGHSTVSVSQNPHSWDSRGRWSRDGQLLFGSQRHGGGIYVWDGTSLKDGAPDVDTFIRLPPELEPDSVTWMDDGSVATLVSSSPSTTKEVTVWDLESESVIRRIPVSSDNAWSSLTGDGQLILSSHLASGIPSYYLDVEDNSGNLLLSTHTGEYSWSPGGYLAYCGIEDGHSRVLSIWDGRETRVVARVSYRPVQWQNVGDTFSCNNG